MTEPDRRFARFVTIASLAAWSLFLGLAVAAVVLTLLSLELGGIGDMHGDGHVEHVVPPAVFAVIAAVIVVASTRAVRGRVVAAAVIGGLDLVVGGILAFRLPALGGLGILLGLGTFAALPQLDAHARWRASHPAPALPQARVRPR